MDRAKQSFGEKIAVIAAFVTVILGTSALLFLIWWVSSFPRKKPPCPEYLKGKKCKPTKKSNDKKLIKLSLQNPKNNRTQNNKKTQLPPAQPKDKEKSPKPTAKVPPKEQTTVKNAANYNYTFVLTGDKIIWKKARKESLSIAQLLELGKRAKKEGRELHLKVRGDAKAKFILQIKRHLLKAGIPYTTEEEF